MAKTPLNRPRDSSVVRRINVKVEVERWNWSTGLLDTLDITNAVMNYQWQMSIKSPSGSATITLLPQNRFRHYLDDINIMDVVKIYEFGNLKWMGYVRKVAAAGYIDQQGNPHRTASFVCTSMGGYLLESIVSVNLQILSGDFSFTAAAANLAQNIAKVGDTVLTYNEEVNFVIDEWKTFIDNTVPGGVHVDYLTRYFDFTTGMSGGETPGYPRELFLFYGEEDEINLWQILEKLAESPLNEFFFDTGPRRVHIDGTETELDDPITYLIGRPTPFDGAVDVVAGTVQEEQFRFRSMETKTIPQPYFTRFDLSKTREEVYSIYVTAPTIYDMSKLELLADGREFQDDVAFSKYLYRLCNKPLYYVSVVDHAENAYAAGAKASVDRAQAVSNTLYNWYKNNDQYLSGTLHYMAMEDWKLDPRIGDKVAVEDVAGSFYIEGVSHSWTYQGPLTAQATVTRGWNITEPIKLRDRVFNRPKTAYGDVRMESSRRERPNEAS